MTERRDNRGEWEEGNGATSNDCKGIHLEKLVRQKQNIVTQDQDISKLIYRKLPSKCISEEQQKILHLQHECRFCKAVPGFIANRVAVRDEMAPEGEEDKERDTFHW